MAGWYVRRGEKIIGPVPNENLRESAATGKLLPTDQLAKDAAGPWTDAAKTEFFPKLAPPVSPMIVQPVTPPAVVETPMADQATPPIAPVFTIIRGAKTVFATFGRGSLAATRSIGGMLSTRAQRKHEIKLAKIQAKAMIEASRTQQVVAPQSPPGHPPPYQSITVSPTIVQSTTIVNVVKKNARGWGCSGCGSILILIILGILIWLAIPPSESEKPSKAPATTKQRGK